MSISTRKKDEGKTGNGHAARVKLRWMELDVEGGTSDLIEGLKSFATALTPTAPVATRVRTLTAANPATSTATGVLETPITEDPNPVEVPAAETAEDLPPDTASGSELDRPKRRPAPRAPKFLSELDLTKASVQLADFVQEKNPDGDMDKYAVIAAWFKEHFNTEEVTVDHIFTAYKALGWQAQLPADPTQTFRNLKSNKNWFDSGSNRGAYKINWNGQSAVNKMGAAKP